MTADEPVKTPEWEYSPYRATLKRKGKCFGLLSQDGYHAIPEPEAGELLRILNAHAELVAALEATDSLLAEWKEELCDDPAPEEGGSIETQDRLARITAARAALTKAGR